MYGDIITYIEDGYPITHRIISKSKDVYVTQGDFNNIPDNGIKKDKIKGKVICHFGKIFNLQFSARIEY